MWADALVGWGCHGTAAVPHLPDERLEAENFLQFFLVFGVGEKSVVPISPEENYMTMAVVRGNAVFWLSRIGGLNRQNTLPQRSRRPTSGCDTGKVAVGSRWAAQCAVSTGICRRKLRNHRILEPFGLEGTFKGRLVPSPEWVTVGPKKEEKKTPPKPINIQKRRRSKCIDLNDPWWLKSLKAIYAGGDGAINSTKGCEGRDGQLPTSGGRCKLMEVVSLWVHSSATETPSKPDL